MLILWPVTQRGRQEYPVALCISFLLTWIICPRCRTDISASITMLHIMRSILALQCTSMCFLYFGRYEDKLSPDKTAIQSIIIVPKFCSEKIQIILTPPVSLLSPQRPPYAASVPRSLHIRSDTISIPVTGSSVKTVSVLSQQPLQLVHHIQRAHGADRPL